jgi:alkylation response protein AidB-like acyl-CoA dehydrogenase
MWLTESELRAAGSDVGGLTTTAEKSADGKSYILNGEKKWVTQGLWATHALIGARTGPAGPKGLSVFIVDLSTKGLSKRKLENSGVSSSGKPRRQYTAGERPTAHN